MKVLPPTYFWILLFGLAVTHIAVAGPLILSSPLTYAGIPLIAFGTGINLWTDRLFKQHGTTVKPGEEPLALIESGPFAVSRHPMYLGMAAFLLGAAILSGKAFAFLFPAVFIILMDRIFIPMEEDICEGIFQERYRAYRKKVRRWI